jgi:hypothetical protein
MHTPPFLANFTHPSAEHNFFPFLRALSPASSSSAGDDFRFLSECVFLLSELADAVVPSEVATAEAEAFRGEVVLSDEDFLCISLVAVASFAFFTNS